MTHLKTIQKDLTPDQRLYQIVEQGMCIGCGICQSVVGPQKIKIEIVQNGCPRPTVSGEMTHEDMDKVMDICPGTQVPGLPDWLVDETSIPPSVPKPDSGTLTGNL